MRWILAAEVVFVLVFLAGVALIFVPAALMIGGVLGVIVVERASARLSAVSSTGERARLRRVV